MPVAQREVKGPLRRKIFERYHGCVVCGTWDANQCGHIIPKSKGGDNSPNNFVRLCYHCNNKQQHYIIRIPFEAPVTEKRVIVEHRRKAWEEQCKRCRETGEEGHYDVREVDANMP